MRKGSQRSQRMRALLAGIAVGGLVVVGGCGSPTSDPSSSLSASVVTTNNQQDAVFASQLIELSEQLVSITDILDAKTDDPAVSAKMDALSRTANERIVLAKSWLKLWGRTAVQAPPPPGLLTEQQQDALIDSSGAVLASAIASATKSQLEGTLAISQAETAGGENTAAKQVAQKLVDQSQAELAVLAQVKVAP
jgi:uncharacterized protein (DUF305 family)